MSKDFMFTEAFRRLNKLEQVQYFMDVHNMSEQQAMLNVYGNDDDYFNDYEY